MFGRALCWLAHRRWWERYTDPRARDYSLPFRNYECSRCGHLWAQLDV